VHAPTRGARLPSLILGARVCALRGGFNPNLPTSCTHEGGLEGGEKQMLRDDERRHHHVVAAGRRTRKERWIGPRVRRGEVPFGVAYTPTLLWWWNPFGQRLSKSRNRTELKHTHTQWRMMKKGMDGKRHNGPPRRFFLNKGARSHRRNPPPPPLKWIRIVSSPNPFLFCFCFCCC